jgi:peptidoglycan/LPS O-acetylase OafA/YrhL
VNTAPRKSPEDVSWGTARPSRTCGGKKNHKTSTRLLQRRGTNSALDSREPVLDGMRGLAILAVLWHHLVTCSGLEPAVRLDHHLWRTGLWGWVGVDLFFVLSGFLITGILYDSRSSGRYYFNFFGRRALRILPLYYGVLALAFLVVPFFLEPRSAEALTHDQAWYWLYLINVKFAFDGWPTPAYLGHFWSLAIEEQFYLIWPLVVRMLSRRRLLLVCVVCFLAALGLRVLLPAWLPNLAVYVLMPTRMDALAAGAALALIARGERGLRVLGPWPAVVAALFIAAALYVYVWKKDDVSTLDPLIRTLGYSILALGFAAVIAVGLTSRPGSMVQRSLTSVPLSVLGKYSYALYVFHQPVMLFMRDLGLQVDLAPTVFGSQLPGFLLFIAVAGTLSFACALLSWRFIEAPMLRLKRHLVSTQVAPERERQG